jgi:hypothetical protein
MEYFMGTVGVAFGIFFSTAIVNIYYNEKFQEQVSPNTKSYQNPTKCTIFCFIVFPDKNVY